MLEVFYQEVGIRLIAYVCDFITARRLYQRCSFRDRIIQKHIKRQIISLSGGFQVIADLNTYHSFINSLKVRLSLDDVRESELNQR